MWITNKLENRQFVMCLFANNKMFANKNKFVMCLLFVYYFFG